MRVYSFDLRPGTRGRDLLDGTASGLFLLWLILHGLPFAAQICYSIGGC